MNAIPLSNRMYAENPLQQLSEDDNNDLLFTEDLRSDVSRINNDRHSRERNHEQSEQNSSATNIVWEATTSPLLRSNRQRETAARPTVRKSPQFLYLTTSLVVALLAVIIAKEPATQPFAVTQPTASVVASAITPSWHEWLNIIRKVPKIQVSKDGVGINSQRTMQPTVVPSDIHLSSSPCYRKVTLAALSFAVQAKEYMARYIDPVLLGKIPDSTVVAKSEREFLQEEEIYSDSSSQQQQQQNKEIKSYSVSIVFTELMDKVISSKLRLVIFVNLILSVCLVTHVAIASYFLGDSREAASDIRGSLTQRVDGGTVGFFPPTDYYSNNAFDHQPFGGRGGGRRRPPTELHHMTSSTYALRIVCGYLLFKLLLISSVLSPLHTLDVLILLTWFTVLCFQRSLAYMAHMNLNRLMMQQTSVTHNQQRTSKKSNNAATGILQLLLIVLCLTFSSGFGWVMFFYKAGIPMVILLLMDSAILIIDIVRYIVIYVQGIILEGSYQARINELEEIQLQQSCGSVDADDSIQTGHSYGQQQDQVSQNNSQIKIKPIKEKGQNGANSVEKDIERAEIRQAFFSSVLQSIIFTLELLSSMVTAFHFLHIWYLHGLSFGLVDAILLLHLQSSVSGVVRKVRHECYILDLLANENILRPLNMYISLFFIKPRFQIVIKNFDFLVA